MKVASLFFATALLATWAYAANPPAPKSDAADTAKQPALKTIKVTPVDLNKASAEKLAKLPGIDQATAEKIVANRPYCSKTGPLAQGLIDRKAYDKISIQIFVSFPYKEANKNAAWCSAKKP